NLSHGGTGPSNFAKVPRGCGVRAVTPAGAGTGQYHMVGSVKHLGTELEVHLLPNGEMLEDRKVLCAAPRVSQVVARTRSERCRSGVGECRRIVPAVLAGIGENRVHARNTVEPGGIGDEIGAGRITGKRGGNSAAL